MKNLSNYTLLLFATIIWALAPAVVKYTLEGIDPFPFLFLRYLVIAIICSPILYKILKRNNFSSYDKMNLVIFSLLGQTSLILFFIGIDKTTAIDSIIIALASPLISIAAGHYFYKEKLNFFKELGIILATIGTLLVIIQPMFASKIDKSVNERIFGNLYILLYQITSTMWLVYSKFLFGKNSIFLVKIFKYFKINLHKKPYKVFDFSFISFYFGFLTFIPLIFFDLSKYTTQIYNLELDKILGILYMAIFSTVLGYYLYALAQSKLSVTDVSIFSYISPLFSIPAAYFILNETPNYYALIGISVIALGLFIAQKPAK